jgi:hypothetical protein
LQEYSFGIAFLDSTNLLLFRFVLQVYSEALSVVGPAATRRMANIKLKKNVEPFVEEFSYQKC